MVHQIAGKARRSIAVAIAALNSGDRDMRRRGIARCRRAIVATRAVGVACLMNIGAARPARISRTRAGVTGDAVATGCRNVAGERSAALRALAALAGEGAVVAGIAACPDHRRMVHRIGSEARCRSVVAIAALDDTGRDMRRRRQPGRRRAIVTI